MKKLKIVFLLFVFLCYNVLVKKAQANFLHKEEVWEDIMSLFDHEARQFKFDVLREVSKRSFEGKLNEDTCDEVCESFDSRKTGRFSLLYL